eukprot:gene18087-36853_t
MTSSLPKLQLSTGPRLQTLPLVYKNEHESLPHLAYTLNDGAGKLSALPSLSSSPSCDPLADIVVHQSPSYSNRYDNEVYIKKPYGSDVRNEFVGNTNLTREPSISNQNQDYLPPRTAESKNENSYRHRIDNNDSFGKGEHMMATNTKPRLKRIESLNPDDDIIKKSKGKINHFSDASKAMKENEELRKMIEAMKAQNQELAHRMEVEQANSKIKIQNVIQEKEDIRNKMESEKFQLYQKLSQAQKETERLLNLEREKFTQLMNKMEQDKNALSERVRATEERSREDALTMLRLREEYGVGLQRMEEEKT